MTRLNPIWTITYKDTEGMCYTQISRDVEKDLERINRELPNVTILCVDRQEGY